MTIDAVARIVGDFSLDASIGFLVNRAAYRLKDALGRELRAHDVTTEQWALLNRLWEEDGLSQKELAERTFKDPPNTARILDKMERKGLVSRRPDASDRRVMLVSLTDRGRALRPALVPLAEGILARGTQGMTAEEVATLRMLLNRVHDNLA